jgi:plastocyanin
MRHRTSAPGRSAAVSTPVRGLLVLGVAAGLAGFGLSAAQAGVRQAGPVKVSGTVDNKFDPSTVTATADASGKVTILFTAHGAHTMQSDEAKFDSGPVSDGQTKTITFAAKPGTYAFYCLYHKSLGMTGTLTVAGAGGAPSSAPGNPDASSPAAAPSEPPASASASASVGSGQEGVGAPTPGASASEEGVPGVAGNKTLARIEEERAAQHGAVSGFRFFTLVAIAFLMILGAAVMFSTRPRRGGA